ncbi:DUF4286 domain-containing protein [bacterium (Candidatus Blackallbacteria) CG17_big_fil_post_rev_8_21_14_2_50_48_46]|uniref:DUF4286 domain-containing protein n=1 Tax=bacterium (Candidatus Blackallbacteria) CG17_big_fil_post_rev_8_21_14_2_50_48_46 TaxID=2014261 RepID=A0A2M7FYH6_9BACT|nr:MAG: hypothetical protein COW64_19365 [bacterium (Candidatus Blackallbacteria) CG18_big_fil_WC_8_21_14_2_50_49_26]PIW13816.1 MAG: DUF4286 domain-containing protein [bacterium (Candidatus Blackallbacteria) CG17_big_fil_post_rev_8_21_14_2_50_48_46]PIW45042.1 MAG: DUF4286 domain-containing protein [bacterium (Candidatus Blackallbacteria) CG13_big_fil_rev_8_21_14_2_50_49_14]
MILYSVTVSLPETLAAEWLQWQKEIHIPEVLATGYFKHHQMQKLLEPVIEAGFVTYNILYTTDSLEKLNNYRMHEAPRLQAQHLERFGEDVFAVRSVMEIC